MKTLKITAVIAMFAFLTTGCGAPTVKTSTDYSSPATTPADSASPSEYVEQGTFDKPFTWGSTLTNGEVEIRLGRLETGVDRVVSKANSFNDPAPDGQIYVRVPVVIKNIGTDKVNPQWDVDVTLVAATGESYEDASVSSGSGPDPELLDDVSALYPGGTGRGYIYFTAPKSILNDAMFAIQIDYSDEVFVMAVGS